MYHSYMWRGKRHSVIATTGSALLLAVVAPACAAPASSASSVKVVVSPPVSLADRAVTIRVTGLAPGEQAAVQVRSTDAVGAHWLASASYHADARGDLDLNKSAATSGSYLGVAGMGLIWSMQPTGSDPAGAYFWNNALPLTFTVTVRVRGSSVASATIQRKLSPGPLTSQTESLQANGFVGEFWRPPAADTAGRAAILVIGGSNGGLPLLLPAMLASSGYPTLSMAYFNYPGLPGKLANIPLEYFAKALRWLASQPGVDPARIAVIGISRGSEAAQLLGVYYPSLVRAVIASVPSNVAICSYPGCAGPAWTLHGRAVPYTRQFDDPAPSDDPKAVIPDQRIQGPVFLDCGRTDQTWISCPYAQAIVGLLDAEHDHWAHVLYSYPDAGHYVGSLVPYEPAANSGADPSYAADQQALALLWPHLLGFLAGFSSSA